MSDLERLKTQMTGLVRSAYDSVDNFDDTKNQRLVFSLVKDSLEKNPIEYKDALLRNVYLETDDFNKMVKRIGKENLHSRDWITRAKAYDTAMEMVPNYLWVELIPKNKVGDTDILSAYQKCKEKIDNVQESRYEYLILDSADEFVSHSDSDKVNFMYETRTTPSIHGFVTLAESKKEENNFRIPTHMEYACPTLQIKDIINGDMSYHTKVLSEFAKTF